MIDKELIENLVNAKLLDTDCFLVDVTVSADNNIVVEIDSDSNLDVDTCAELSRCIDSSLDREVEDFSLEVGSAGLTSPLKIVRQYKKYIGKEVEVMDSTGKKHVGILVDVDADEFSIDETKMERRDGDKRKKPYTERLAFAYNEIKYTKYIINLK